MRDAGDGVRADGIVDAKSRDRRPRGPWWLCCCFEFGSVSIGSQLGASHRWLLWFGSLTLNAAVTVTLPNGTIATLQGLAIRAPRARDAALVLHHLA
jgi:hypothetical protein